MERRLICPDCRTKWFTPGRALEQAACGRCGATLEPLDDEAEETGTPDPPGGYGRRDGP